MLFKRTKAALLAITGVTVLVLAGAPPASAQTETKPIDLVLGGEGATSWNITNIKPADRGSKTVRLHNAGTKDGFVTIWISNIVSGEGLNPESETGNTTEPGELDDHLSFNLTARGLGSNIKLPSTIKNFPPNATGPAYIEVIPVKASDNVDLRWDWELPAGTGNDCQGDNLSFTINYLLRECRITDVSQVVTAVGAFTKVVTADSETGKGKVTIEKDTIGRDKESKPLSEIWVIETDKKPPPPPVGTATIGASYDAGPHGTTFDRPVTVTLSYNPDDIPQGVSTRNLAIALWNEDRGAWVTLPGSAVDSTNNTVSAPVKHFSRYTIIAPLPPPPPALPSGTPPAKKVKPEPVRPAIFLETDMLGKTRAVEIEADGTLRESVMLTDPAGNFILDIESGTRVTGAAGMELHRIEITIAEERIVIPDGLIVLSPIYRLTGYTRSMESTRINFDRAVGLTISYRPGALPDNVFPPFVARYAEPGGWIKLTPPSGLAIEIGKAKAEIYQASLFAVMAQLAPLPPPLPAKFMVTNLTITPRQAQLGQPVIISVTIANEGETIGSYELYLTIDGIVRAVKEVALAGKSSQTLRFEVSDLAEGEHQVKVAGLTGRFSIISTAAFVAPARPRINWLMIDLSIVGLIAIGLLVLYLIVRRPPRPQPENLGQGEQAALDT